MATKTTTTKTTRDHEAEYMDRYIEIMQDEFQGKIDKFLEDASSDPCHAIRWSMDLMVAQTELEAWLLVEKMVGIIGTEQGTKAGIESREDAIREVVSRIEADLLSGIDNGESTDPCFRAEHAARQRGRKNVLPSIKGFLSAISK